MQPWSVTVLGDDSEQRAADRNDLILLTHPPTDWLTRCQFSELYLETRQIYREMQTLV